MAVNIKKLQMWFTGAQRTELGPDLINQMTQLDDLNNFARLMIERIRRVAQPNKAHRVADPNRLVPPSEATNERLQLVKAFQEGAVGCFKDNPGLVTFLKISAEAEQEMNRFQDRYLRQAQIYAVNELKKFCDVTYMEVRNAFDEMNRRRTAYDFGRDRLRYCPRNEIEQRGQEAMKVQKEFEQQALALYELLARIPEYQMEIAKACNNFIKAEAEFARVAYATLKPIKDPGGSPRTGSGKGPPPSPRVNIQKPPTPRSNSAISPSGNVSVSVVQKDIEPSVRQQQNLKSPK